MKLGLIMLQVKAENAGNDAVTDEVAGRAYAEQFGLETFQRADNAVRANKASRYATTQAIEIGSASQQQLKGNQTDGRYFPSCSDISGPLIYLGSP